MTERSSDLDESATPNATPEDIATLYSRANVQGAYWDFSASRREARGQFRDQRAREEAERSEAERLAAIAPSQDQDKNLDQDQIKGKDADHDTPRAALLEAQVRSSPMRTGDAGLPAGVRGLTEAIAGGTWGTAADPSRGEKSAGPRAPWPVSQREPMARHSVGYGGPGGAVLPTREDLGSRWYGLQSVLAVAERTAGGRAAITVAREGRPPPVVAVFSLAGGVGKTCLVATLGRALSALGERVLLADTATDGLLAFYYGAREFKPGIVRTFSPPSFLPGAEGDAAIHVLSLEAGLYPGDGGEHDPLLGELVRDGRGVNRVLVDVATANREVTRRLLVLRPLILVPIIPDMSSVAILGSLEAFLAGASSPEAGKTEALYLLNQFDASLPLHVDLREVLRQQLGDRLLPFVVRRSSAVSEALAEGMTVIDYAPGSAAAEDYWKVAEWLRSLATQAAITHGRARWSER